MKPGGDHGGPWLVRYFHDVASLGRRKNTHQPVSQLMVEKASHPCDPRPFISLTIMSRLLESIRGSLPTGSALYSHAIMGGSSHQAISSLSSHTRSVRPAAIAGVIP